MSPEILEDWLRAGAEHPRMTVISGIPEGARLIGVDWISFGGHVMVALVFDREVKEPTFVSHA